MHNKLKFSFKLLWLTTSTVPLANRVCFKSNPILEPCDCKLECIGTTCLNQTLGECDSAENCQCLPNFKPPDCCNCLDNDDEAGIIYYKDGRECKRECLFNLIFIHIHSDCSTSNSILGRAWVTVCAHSVVINPRRMRSESYSVRLSVGLSMLCSPLGW